MSRVAVTVVFDIDNPETLPGDPGWAAPDGDHEPPTTGVELWAHKIAQHAIRAAIDTTPGGLSVFLDDVQVAVLDGD